jgi:hypothetical protein
MNGHTLRFSRLMLALTCLALLVPGRALAATAKPVVTTGAAANVGQQTVTLTGTVNPRGLATTYSFQYGPTIVYGSTSAPTPLGAANSGQAVAVNAVALAPATRYHYRLVAHNAKGTVAGADHTFTTKVQPLGVSLVATPNPVPFGSGTTLGGALTGTGNVGRAVQLQGNPFPYTQGFLNIGNAQLTGAGGAFSFPVPSVPLNSQYRVLMPDRPAITSPIISVGVLVRVSTHVRERHASSGISVRFSGTVRPARDGAQFAIQKHSGSGWASIAGSITHHGSTTFSRYEKTVHLHHSGSYRVFVGIVDGNFTSNVGRTVHIHIHG